MRVIPFPGPSGDDVAVTPRAPGRNEAQIRGRFHSPSGRAGRMSGRLLVDGFEVVDDQFFAAGVITGELRDADGSVVGVDSRRCVAPAEILRDGSDYGAVIGPLDVDLFGLLVSIPAFRMNARSTEPLSPVVPIRPCDATRGQRRLGAGR